MKRLCLLLLVLFFVFPLIAQPEKGYVYLKNGSILKGKYQYSNDFEKLKVESAGNLWIFSSDEVDSIRSFQAFRLNSIETTKTQKNSLYYRTEIGVLAGNSDNSQTAPFSVSLSANYLAYNNLSAGLGIGIEFLKESYLPLFINLEYKLRKSYSIPYLFFKGGYQIPIEESNMIYYDVYPAWSSVWPGPDYYNEKMDAKGGVLVNPGIGYQRMFSGGFGMTVAFGYQFHRLHYKGESDYALDIDYNRLTIKLGIIFY